MNNQFRNLFFALAALIAAPTSAQSRMIIDGTCEVLLSTSTVLPAVKVEPVSGNLIVTSNGGFNCAGASVSLTAPAAVNVGTQFTIAWDSVGTTGCSRSGGTAGWAGSGSPSSSLTLNAPLSPTTESFDISCATGAAPVTDSKNVVFSSLPTVDLVASASAVPVSSTFTLSWSSTGTTGCTPSGGAGTSWASLGPQATNDSVQLTAPASAASNVAFQLTCASSGSPVSDSELISFTDGLDCSNVPLPPGINGFSQRVWSSEYGNPFPMPYSANPDFGIIPGQGLRFAITPTIPVGGQTPNGGVLFNEHNTTPKAGFMTISRCPGDFRLDVLNVPAGCALGQCTNQCHTGSEAQGQQNLKFRMVGSQAGWCHLIPGQQYYVNIHFGNTTPGPDGAFCAGPVCRIIGGTNSAGFNSTTARALKWLESDLLGVSEVPRSGLQSVLGD